MRFMEGMLAKIRGMSPRERSLVAGCLLLAAGIAAAKWAILPAYTQHKKNLVTIRQRVATIEKYEAFRNGQGLIDGEARRLAERLGRWKKGCWRGTALRPQESLSRTAQAACPKAFDPDGGDPCAAAVKEAGTSKSPCSSISRPPRGSSRRYWPISPGSRNCSGCGSSRRTRGCTLGGRFGGRKR